MAVRSSSGESRVEDGGELGPGNDSATTVHSPRRIYAAMSGLVIAFLAANLDFTIVGTALPTIAGELGGFDRLSWVVSSFALATAVTTPIWGKLGDLHDRKTVFIVSFSVFLVGSALCGMGQDMTQLIAFRAIQGLGAGGLLVGGMAIVGALVPAGERAKYQGLMAIIMPLAILSGPLIGGLFADGIGWRWAFYINLPLGALALLLLITQLHLPSRERVAGRVDVIGMGTLAVAIVALTLLTSVAGTRYDWSSAPVLALAGITLLAAVVFVRWERSAADPVVPLRLFTERNFTVAAILGFLSGLVMFGAVTFLPLYQQMVQGISPTHSGLMMLPLLGGMLLVAPAVGTAVSRTGRYRIFPITGAAAMTTGMFVLAGLSTDSSQWTVVAGMLAAGIGMGCFMQLTVVIAQNSVTGKDLGAATGTAMLARNLGNSLGVSVLGALYGWQLTRTLGDRALPPGYEQLTESTDLTPGELDALPESVRDTLSQAVTAGSTVVFLASGIGAVIMMVAALLLRDAAIRGEH